MCTSARSKESTRRSRALDRPFDKSVLAKAKAIADQCKIIVEFEDGDWYGHALEYPEAMGDGKTPQAAVADTRGALVAVVAYMLEEGQKPPASAREGQRSVQVNVRLTPEEKALLESKAKAKGCRGLSDFIRTSVLTEK